MRSEAPRGQALSVRHRVTEVTITYPIDGKSDCWRGMRVCRPPEPLTHRANATAKAVLLHVRTLNGELKLFESVTRAPGGPPAAPALARSLLLLTGSR
ncbi:hypothetical protein EVAR_24836_1 [Eumeta japonica]|uniref:Uncharacterized protein n=1 Tax=Eumeta variegata TaxID=151549 RepID=A0A4C1Y8M9_EUMVA|nr:hypothetical protein EVAR_24836_1 [Eumeta japonica]